MFKIGTSTLPHGLVLAPMAGVGDRAMRRVCAAHGAEYAVTEMVSAKALVYEQRARASLPPKTGSLCRLDGIIPEAVQLFGADPAFIADAATLLAAGAWRGFSGALPVAIDINMGCPVRKVVSGGEGSALMRSPDLIYRIVAATVAACPIPVTVKMRAGWDTEHVNAPECALAAVAGGAAAVCVHARTRDRFYTPGIDIDVIRKVKAALPDVPVIGNGDITCGADALAMIAVTGCDGVAVGRAAMGNPFLFDEIAASLDGRPYTPPTADERRLAAMTHLTLAADDTDKGERRGIAEAKQTLARYFTGMPGAARARDRIMNAVTRDAIADALDEVFGA